MKKILLIQLLINLNFGFIFSDIQNEKSRDQFTQRSVVQDDKVIQDFNSESLLSGADHSQRVSSGSTQSDSGLKDCVNLSSSTASSRFNTQEPSADFFETEFLDDFSSLRSTEIDREQKSAEKELKNNPNLFTSGSPDVKKSLGANIPHFDEQLIEGLTIDLREPIICDGTLMTEKGGVIAAPGIRIQAKKMICGKEMVIAEGDVMIEYGSELFVGEKIEYNFLTKTGYIIKGRGAMYPWYFGGEKITLCPDNLYRIESAFFTTSEGTNCDWQILTKEASIQDNCILRARHLQIRIMDHPIFYVPYFAMNLDFIFDTPIRYFVRIDGRRGTRFGIQYKLFTWGRFSTYLRVDYRLFKGPGGGFEVHYTSQDHKERFQMINYGARDNSISNPSQRFRYRFQGSYRNILLDDKVSIQLNYDKLSDKYMATDYDDTSLKIAIAEQTQFIVRRQEWLWLANLITKPRVNTFQTLKQELPTLELNARPLVLGKSYIIMENNFRASYLDFDYTNRLINVSDYSSFRMEYQNALYRNISLGFLNVNPEAGGLVIFYQNSPKRKSQFLTVGQLGGEISTSLYKCYSNYKHVIKPYINYTYYTFPTSKPNDHYIFDIGDGWFRLNTTRFGVKQNLYAKQENGCVTRFLKVDTFGYAFINTPTIQEIIPRVYADLTYQFSPFLKTTVQSAWDFERNQVAHFNTLFEWTLDETYAMAVEYRHRNAFDFRKVDYFNFILDSFRSEQDLRRSQLSDRRDTFLVHLYYQFYPGWAVEFSSRQGWNRTFEPGYLEYEVDLYGTIRSAWNVHLSYQHKEHDDRFSFSFSIGMKRPNEKKFRNLPPCVEF